MRSAAAIFSLCARVIVRNGDSSNASFHTARYFSPLRDGLIEPRPTNGVGVRNVQERIHVYFGLEYGVSFESAPGAGTVATVRIPMIPGGAT